MEPWNCNAGLLEQLTVAAPGNQASMLTRFIVGRIQAMLEAGEGDAIGPASRFEHLGIDSRYALEFKEYLENELDCSLRTTLLFDYPTPAGLAAHLLELKFTAAPQDAAPAVPAIAAAGAASIEERMLEKLRKYQL